MLTGRIWLSSVLKTTFPSEDRKNNFLDPQLFDIDLPTNECLIRPLNPAEGTDLLSTST